MTLYELQELYDYVDSCLWDISDLGHHYSSMKTSFSVFAPTTQRMSVVLDQEKTVLMEKKGDSVCVKFVEDWGKFILVTREDVLVFKKLGYVCRLLVRAEHLGDNRVCAFVEPTLLSPSEPEASVRRNDNLIGLVGRNCGQQYFFGQGAGRNPTAFAVVLGLTDILNNVRLLEDRMPSGRAIVDNSQMMHRYYVRTTTRLSIPAEKLRGTGDVNCYFTAPMAVDRMHALAASLRMRDPDLFFAAVRG